MEAIQLTYRSSTLRESDIRLFTPSHWLNDQCINFYFEYLSERHREYLFLDPASSFILLFEDDIQDLRDSMSQIEFSGKKGVFIAVNDNTDPTIPAAGCHWTLLAISFTSNTAYLYDSIRGKSTVPNATKILSQFARLHSTEYREIHIDYTHPQNNFSDCGVYVLLTAEEIVKIGNEDAFSLRSIQNCISPLTAGQLRERILGIIEEMKRNK